MIEVKIAGRRAVCTESALLTSGSVGISIAFEFDGAWEGMSKAAVFIAGDTKIDVLLTEDICLIPWEVLQEPGLDLIVGVYGTNGDTIAMPTVYTNVGRIRHGADFDGSEGTEPTPALVDQIMAAAQNAVDTADSVREDADAGVFDGDPGFSPTVAVTDIEGGHRVTITDAEGDHVFDVLDGQGGGGGTGDHNQLTNRDAANQHPMSAITGLLEELDDFISADETVEAETVNLSDVAISGSYNDLINKLTAGENISIDENNVISAAGGGGGDNVFNVEYGVTPIEDIKGAYDTGKVCQMIYDDRVYYLVFMLDSGTLCYFTSPKQNGIFDVVSVRALQGYQAFTQRLQKEEISDTGNYFSTDTVEGALQELGAAKLSPESKTSDMTQPVGVDTDGKLYTAPGGGGGSVTPAKLLDVTVENASEFQQNVDLSGYNNFLIVIGGKKNDAAVSISTGRIYRNHNEYYIGYYTSFLPAGSPTYPVGCIVENIRFFDEDSFIGDYVQYSTEIAPSAKTWQGQGSSNPQPRTAVVTKNSVKPNEQDKIFIQLSAEIESLTVKIFGY